MRLKFQSTLKEQYDTQWAINHETMLLVEFRLTLAVNAPLSKNLSSLSFERNLHNVHLIHQMTPRFLLCAAVKDSLCSPPVSF